MIQPNFIHLRVHSDYSIIDGIAKINLLIKKAVALNMPALAITDLNNMFGLIKFYRMAHNVGLKPIIGVDCYVYNELFSPSKITQLTMLAMNDNGYQNIISLISKSYQYRYKALIPYINRNWLITYNRGILLLSGGIMGDIGYGLSCHNNAIVSNCLHFYKQYFKDRFYIELIRTGRPNEEKYIQTAIMLAEEYDLPVVATNDVRFINKEDFDAHELKVAMYDGYTLNDPKRPQKYSPQQYMRSEIDMCTLFADIPAALKNSVEIAKRCNVTICLGKYFLPHFPTGNMSTEDFLIKQSRYGLEKRLELLFPDIEQRQKYRLKYDHRLNTELDVINKMGFPGYFLIVMEFIQWSKNNGVPVGPGRGSGAGSLVAYALNITDLDPLEFNLLFERFLNPERVSMPDFDIDFCMEKRDQVIEHVANMYGHESVSQIITFGTFTAKSVIRDVGRTLGYPYSFVDRISKLIPPDSGMTLDKAFKVELELSKIYDTDEEVRVLVNMARKLEGTIRNISKHAGGLVISPTKITDFTPLYYDENGKYPVTQFDKTDIEYIGLVKFDFLGLRTLTIIDRTLNMINKRRNKNSKTLLDITTIPLNDKKSFELLQRSETTAVFQLESFGMKDLIKRLQPDCFEDIIALIALFRPGPLQSGMVDNFIDRKHGREKIFYPDIQWQHDSLKSILRSTYGIILYQEQVMQIAQVLSGYTLGGADMLRRAMGKKNQVEMNKQRSIFEEGAKNNGIDGRLAVKIFDLVEKFAGYGFNKSHSAAYALISYQTLWLKAHYPAEFMAAAMTADMYNTEKIVELIDECRRIGLHVLPPDINTGMYHFHVNQNNEIVYGIGAIKGIGESPITAILKARQKGGYFHDLFDLCIRSNIKKINRKVLENLIISGACDSLGTNRATLMNILDNALQAANQHAKTEAVGQCDMFGIFVDNISNQKTTKYNTNCSLRSDKIILDGEQKTLGVYLTDHPINQYLNEIEYYINGLWLKNISQIKPGTIVTIAGLVVAAKIVLTKYSNRIGIYTLDDHSGRLDIILFKDILNKYKQFLEKGRVVIVKGQINFDNISKKLKMIAHELMDINEARKKIQKDLLYSNSK